MMNLEIKRKILHLAYDIRWECEDIQANNEDDYTPDLCGMCAIASIKLHKELEYEKIKTKIIIGKYHCYLLYENKYVIDVTATQYGFKEKILIESLSKMLKTEYYNKEYSTYSRKMARKYLLKQNWEITQIPSLSDTL